MPDYFNWKTDRLDAETLYFYSTLLRLGYQRNTELWQLLGLLEGQVDQVFLSPAVGLYGVWFSMVKGPSGGAFIMNGSETWWQRSAQFIDIQQRHEEPWPGEISEFYFDRMNEIFNRFVEMLPSIPAGGLTTCGHSMGGAISQLAGQIISLRSPSRFQGCITAGSVRVGSPAYAQGTTFRVVRLENVGDPIPHWPPKIVFQLGFDGDRFIPIPAGEYSHAGEQWLLGHDGSIVITKGYDVRGEYPPPPRMLRRIPVADVTINHFIRDYARRIRSRIAHALSVKSMLANQRLHVLDVINIALNDLEGEDWKIDPKSGLPTASLINPNEAAPSPGVNVNAPDP